jgi:hypothetical protein
MRNEKLAQEVPDDKEPTTSADSMDSINFCQTSNDSNNICNTQWVQLYSTAAYFPLNPSESDRETYQTYFSNFTDQCRDSLIGGCIERAMKVLPPRKDVDRNEMMMWVCSLESLCRKEAGLPSVQCRSSKLQKRWGYEDGYL